MRTRFLLLIVLAWTVGGWKSPCDHSSYLQAVEHIQQSVVTLHDPFAGAVRLKTFSFENPEDLDFDGQPDDWIRRKGDGFPQYVKVAIDRKSGYLSNQSLRMSANGGAVAYYSPQIPIDMEHTYVFEGFINTVKLKNTAAIITLSFLNHRRERVQRFVSEPITHTIDGWKKVQIGPVTPLDEVRFCIIGCHLVNGEEFDIEGDAWFDQLWLGKLPRFGIISNFETHFRTKDAPVQIKSRVMGLDPGYQYRLHLELRDFANNILQQKTFDLEADKKMILPTDDSPVSTRPVRKPVLWELQSQGPGYYRVHSQLQRNTEIIVDTYTSFVSLDLKQENSPKGEFGWSMPNGAAHIPVEDITNIASEAGIHWVKYPVWDQHNSNNQKSLSHTGIFLTNMVTHGINPIGLLNHPPEDLRKKFAQNWRGISEIFSLPPMFWRQSIDSVMASYSSSIRYWQLGDDTDHSFVGNPRLSELLLQLKKEFDRIGLASQIGFYWEENVPLPVKDFHEETFVSIDSRTDSTMDELQAPLRNTAHSGITRMLLIRPLPVSTANSIEKRAADLMKKMVIAKVAGANAIFVPDVFHPEQGLLFEDGSPRELFLPWRTTALALQNATYLGSIRMPNRSENHVFARDGEAIMVIWNNSTKPIEEITFLGLNVKMMDMWGNEVPVPITAQGDQMVPVSENPMIMRGCSEKVLKWILSARFEKGRLPSSTEFHSEALLGTNTFTNGVAGSVTITGPKEWEIDPKTFTLGLAKDENYRLPLFIKLPASTSIGKQPVRLDYVVDDDQTYKFSIIYDYDINVKDVQLTVNVFPGQVANQLVLEQIIANRTNPAELLDFRCSVEIPGRRKQEKYVTKLGSGQEVKRTYFINDAHLLTSQKFKVRAEQVDGSRVLNYLWENKE
jgi:hypothetical protein